MNYKTLLLDKEKIKFLVFFGALSSVIIIAPFFKNQIITGSIVNAVFFIGTIFLGAKITILIAFIPSLIALGMGTLPLVFIPVVPYIIISNIILILVFSLFKNKNYFLAVLLSSFSKFIFLFVSSAVIAKFVFEISILENLGLIMGYYQLITAILGGFITYLFLNIYKIKDKKYE